jgi:ribosomal protein L11 methyltransferase
MFSLRLICPADMAEYVAADLWEEGTCGIRELECEPSERRNATELIAAFETDPTQADARGRQLLARFAKWNPRWEPEEAADWVASTKASWPAREVGETWFVVPPWNQEPTPQKRRRLVLNPGLACGTGDHPCTQMALAALEATVRPGDRVADIGSGSGILAIASLAMGARLAAAVDPDDSVVASVRENLALNGMAGEAEPLLLVTGSADCLRSGTFDVTVANISSTVILMLSEDLLRITRPGGWVVLTGFSREEGRAFDGIVEAEEVEELDDWCCLRGRKRRL